MSFKVTIVAPKDVIEGWDIVQQLSWEWVQLLSFLRRGKFNEPWSTHMGGIENTDTRARLTDVSRETYPAHYRTNEYLTTCLVFLTASTKHSD